MKTPQPHALAPVPVPTPQLTEAFIKSRIFTIRGVQVLLDQDLATLFGVGTKALNQAVKRNIKRFPERFMFQTTEREAADLRSQFVTSSWGGRRYNPFAFTEHGVIMLASVLRSSTAIAVSLRVVEAFVAMRKALASMAPLLTRIDAVERRQITDQSRNEERFDTIFKAMDGGDFPPQKVFFDGKHYDAFSFARKLVRKATKSLLLVDPYCDDTTLDILAQKRGGAAVTIATTQKSASKFLTPTALAKFNKQNPPLALKTTAAFHDRFLVLDGTELYHFGASLKDLGRKYCAVTRMDPTFIPSILQRI